MVGNDDNDFATAPNDISSHNSYILWDYKKYLEYSIGQQKNRQESRMGNE